VDNEGFHLLAGGFAEGLGTAEVDGVGLDEVGSAKDPISSTEQMPMP
jgi:hypothetical protein